MPKSSNFTEPSAVTRMLLGLRSRCTTRCWCAKLTAAHTCRNKRTRSRVPSDARIAVTIDGLARDELHDDVGKPLRRGATIEQPRDVAMIERRKDLTFVLEALFGEWVAHVGAHELDGDFGAVLIVIAHGLVDVAHATGADDFDQAIRADAFAGASDLTGIDCGRAQLDRHESEEVAGRIVRVQQ